VTLRYPRTSFAVTALTVATICVAILHSPAFRINPDVAAWGVTFDLTITIPLLYYIFLVRPRHVAPLTIIPVFVICMALAARVIPTPHQFFLHDLRFLGAPLEVVVIALVVRRAAALRRAGLQSDDALTRFRIVATELTGNARIGDAVGFEVATFWYAFFGWRKEEPRGGFTFHRRSEWPTILACIIVLLVAESIALHLFVMRWSMTAAWVVTFFDVYGIVWLSGDYQALRLRRTTIENDALVLRYGIRWDVTVDFANIASIETVNSESQWKRKGVLKVAILDEPRLLVTLREPMVAHGLAGITKTISAIALLPDDPESFEAAFEAALRPAASPLSTT
jgi:hypothetical protein